MSLKNTINTYLLFPKFKNNFFTYSLDKTNERAELVNKQRREKKSIEKATFIKEDEKDYWFI